MPSRPVVALPALRGACSASHSDTHCPLSASRGRWALEGWPVGSFLPWLTGAQGALPGTASLMRRVARCPEAAGVLATLGPRPWSSLLPRPSVDTRVLVFLTPQPRIHAGPPARSLSRVLDLGPPPGSRRSAGCQDVSNSLSPHTALPGAAHGLGRALGRPLVPLLLPSLPLHAVGICRSRPGSRDRAVGSVQVMAHSRPGRGAACARVSAFPLSLFLSP